MRHLVIGSGHMGTLHGEILKNLGDIVDYIDIDFDPKAYYQQHDSVLICTPAETHAEIINDLPDMPIFCEKPIITDLEQKIAPKRISLVAINWYWCGCIKNKKKLRLEYENKSPYAKLDMAHFLWPSAPEVDIFFRPGDPKSYADGRRIHKNGPCDMFERQMTHWRDVIKKRAISLNTIEQSVLNISLLFRQRQRIPR